MSPPTPKQRPAPPIDARRDSLVRWLWTAVRAGRLVGRGDFVAAERLCRQILDRDPSDWFALMILADCCERQGRLPEALSFARECTRGDPPSLAALKMATRLAVAIGEHEEADEYVRRALAMPEIQNEIPREGVYPRGFFLLVRALAKLPWLRRRIPPEEIAQLDIGVQAQQLKEWKTWAQQYLAWRAGDEATSTPPDTLVH